MTRSSLSTAEPSTAPTSVTLMGPGDAGRSQAESFVCETFAAAHGAEIRHFLPLLMGLRDDSGQLLGVLGLRDASQGSLFLEHYLDAPIESCLSASAGQHIERADIVEIGNLAVGSAGGGRWLITALTAFMHGLNKGWVVFTCGPQLRNAFQRLGLPLIDLGEALPQRLPAGELAHWGRYYQQRPHLFAGRVETGYRLLSALFEQECALRALWRGALMAGGRQQWS